MRAPENPPAFPFVAYSKRAGSEAIYSDVTKGMTLRDWFAGQALIGLCAARGHTEIRESCGAAFADAAYVMADAMLAARSTS